MIKLTNQIFHFIELQNHQQRIERSATIGEALQACIGLVKTSTTELAIFWKDQASTVNAGIIPTSQGTINKFALMNLISDWKKLSSSLGGYLQVAGHRSLV